jgi:uncharacterized membrane protein
LVELDYCSERLTREPPTSSTPAASATRPITIGRLELLPVAGSVPAGAVVGAAVVGAAVVGATVVVAPATVVVVAAVVVAPATVVVVACPTVAEAVAFWVKAAPFVAAATLAFTVSVLPAAPAVAWMTSVCGETVGEGRGDTHWQVTAETEITHDDKPEVADTNVGVTPFVLI